MYIYFPATARHTTFPGPSRPQLITKRMAPRCAILYLVYIHKQAFLRRQCISALTSRLVRLRYCLVFRVYASDAFVIKFTWFCIRLSPQRVIFLECCGFLSCSVLGVSEQSFFKSYSSPSAAYCHVHTHTHTHGNNKRKEIAW